MNKDNLIEFAKEQCEIFPEDSYMGKYLRKTMKMLQESPCEDVPDTNVGNKMQAEHCEDSISREDVIKAIDRHTFNTDDGLCLDEDISIILEELPTVKPTRKKGKWIKSNIGGAKVCSICQAHMGLSNFNYCPNCGAKMGSEEE